MHSFCTNYSSIFATLLHLFTTVIVAFVSDFDQLAPVLLYIFLFRSPMYSPELRCCCRVYFGFPFAVFWSLMLPCSCCSICGNFFLIFTCSTGGLYLALLMIFVMPCILPYSCPVSNICLALPHLPQLFLVSVT